MFRSSDESGDFTDEDEENAKINKWNKSNKV
jgi:hypothetical protein